MKSIIVDDEPRAIELLKGYLNHFKTIELVGTFRNGLKAFEFLTKEKIDLVFLDINMPHISGISLSKMLDGETKIIFTTAYSEYAVESYELQAVDYLLKPISLDRFTRAISKVLVENSRVSTENENHFVFVKSGSKTYRIHTNEINYIEKDGNYATYFMDNQKVVARESVLASLEKLPDHFMQVHKSFVVNTNKVSSIDKDCLCIQDTEIPVGASFKKAVWEKLLK